jgi:hypothetical protein
MGKKSSNNKLKAAIASSKLAAAEPQPLLQEGTTGTNDTRNKSNSNSISNSNSNSNSNNNNNKSSNGLFDKEIEYYSYPTTIRSKPDMRAMRKKPYQFHEDLMTNIDESLGRISKTAERFIYAFESMDNIEQGLKEIEEHKYPSNNKEQPISILREDNQYIKICIDFIHANTNTDHRIPWHTSILKKFPYPSCSNDFTDLRLQAGSSSIRKHGSQLNIYIGAKEIIILLTTAIVRSLSSSSTIDHQTGYRSAAMIVHELHIHAESHNNSNSSDGGGKYWKKDNIDNIITENEIRFALATAGIKISRNLYRDGGNNNNNSNELFGIGKIKSKDLYNSIKCFANDQIKYKPESGVGYYNLSWIASQSPRQNESDGLAAAADCLWMMKKSYEKADLEDDDFLKSKSRIEAAACLCLGGGGIIGLRNKNSDTVERDMRNKAFRVLNVGESSILLDTFMVRGQNHSDRMTIMQNEHRRGAESIQGTTLESGEKLLIAPWDVRRLWNTAMLSYDALCGWGMGHIVYGEASGWDAVSDSLQFWNQLSNTQYALAPVEPGFPSSRDKRVGHKHCGWCGVYGGNEFKQCSRCRKACYCSKSCATKDWKKGGHKQRCIPYDRPKK